MRTKINVVKYDPEWKTQFTMEGTQIRALLAERCEMIYHIGSTAVPGLMAEPTIDIMAVVKDIGKIDQLNAEFKKLGYECKGEYGIPGRRFYVKGDPIRTHQVSIYQKDNTKEIDRLLAVGEYLRSHPTAMNEYSEFKAKLAEEFTFNVKEYTEKKGAFLDKLEQEALKWKDRQERIGKYVRVGTTVCVIAGGIIGGVAFGSIATGSGVGLIVGLLGGAFIGTKRVKE